MAGCWISVRSCALVDGLVGYPSAQLSMLLDVVILVLPCEIASLPCPIQRLSRGVYHASAHGHFCSVSCDHFLMPFRSIDPRESRCPSRLSPDR